MGRSKGDEMTSRSVLHVFLLRVREQLVDVCDIAVHEDTWYGEVGIAWERRVRSGRKDAVVVWNLPLPVCRDDPRIGVECRNGLPSVEGESSGVLFSVPVRCKL